MKAVTEIEQQVTKLGGKPSNDSGAWGTYAKAVTGAAKIFGDKSALKALKEGEEHGLKQYKDLRDDMADGDISVAPAQFFSERIPKQERHINALDKLIESL